MVPGPVLLEPHHPDHGHDGAGAHHVQAHQGVHLHGVVWCAPAWCGVVCTCMVWCGVHLHGVVWFGWCRHKPGLAVLDILLLFSSPQMSELGFSQNCLENISDSDSLIPLILLFFFFFIWHKSDLLSNHTFCPKVKFRNK